MSDSVPSPAPAPAPAAVSADPWPREIALGGTTATVFQPQIEKWSGNQLEFRMAVAMRPAGGKDEVFGVVWGTARTLVDRVARTVVLDEVTLYRASFPTLADGEYYWVDLIGCEVVNREGVVMGVVKDLLSTGPQTVIVAQREQDGKAQETLIPFVGAYVDAVQLPERRILVDWQLDY